CLLACLHSSCFVPLDQSLALSSRALSLVFRSSIICLRQKRVLPRPHRSTALSPFLILVSLFISVRLASLYRSPVAARFCYDEDRLFPALSLSFHRSLKRWLSCSVS